MGPLDIWRGGRSPSLAGSWDNFSRDFERMTRDLERFFGHSLGRGEGDINFIPACDIQETDEAYQLSMDVPGVAKDDIEVEVIGHTVKISGERKHQKESKHGSSQRTERSYGKFVRTFTLPDQVDEEKIDAKYENGELLLTLPKTERSTTKKISIQ